MTSDSWDAIEAHELQRLTELFESDSGRLDAFAIDAAGLHFDWSKTHLDRDLVGKFTALAEAMDFASRRDALFAGAIVNATEGRPAEHIAERGSGAPEDQLSLSLLSRSNRDGVFSVPRTVVMKASGAKID